MGPPPRKALEDAFFDCMLSILCCVLVDGGLDLI